jgi:hypothetical protein
MPSLGPANPRDPFAGTVGEHGSQVDHPGSLVDGCGLTRFIGTPASQHNMPTKDEFVDCGAGRQQAPRRDAFANRSTPFAIALNRWFVIPIYSIDTDTDSDIRGDKGRGWRQRQIGMGQ